MPNELVVETLALLPVDSLIWAKYVQKSCYALIANPTFIVKQLCNQLHNKKTTCVLLKSKVPIGVGAGEKGNGLSLLILCNKTETSPGVDHVSVIDNIVHIPFSKKKMFTS